MKIISKFLLQNLVTGFFALLPVLLLYLLVGQLFDMSMSLSAPFIDLLPASAFSNVTQQRCIAALLLLACLCLVGLIARTEAGKRFGKWLERRYLYRLPQYEMLRNLTQLLSGSNGVSRFAPAIVSLGPGRRQIAFIVEAHTNGDYTIFVPLAPTPSVGTIEIVTSDRVQVLDTPGRQALNCLLSWGDGTEALLTPHSPAQPSAQDET